MEENIKFLAELSPPDPPDLFMHLVKRLRTERSSALLHYCISKVLPGFVCKKKESIFAPKSFYMIELHFYFYFILFFATLDTAVYIFMKCKVKLKHVHHHIFDGLYIGIK